LKTGGRADSLYYHDKNTPRAPDSQGISSLLDQLALKLDETFTVRSGSGLVKPLGGHIHISGVALDTNFLAALDQFIAKPLNEVSNTKLRVSHGYGRLSAVDSAKPHGGFEYRSPLSWLSTPDITKGVVAVAWVLTKLQKHGHINHVQTWDDFYEEYPAKAMRRLSRISLPFLLI
jgi:hypothetical protein